MTESLASIREVFFGLEEYLKFKNQPEQIEILRAFGKIMDSDNVERALFEYCIKQLNENSSSKDNMFKSIVAFNKKISNDQVIVDAMSRSQMRSKIWLIKELAKIKQGYPNVLLMAGWFGQLKFIYDQRLTYSKMRIVELDRAACETSDYIFNSANFENYKVKSVHANVNELTLHKNGYEWSVENFKESTSYTEKFLPDLIINTSAEHMTEEWFHQLRFKQLEGDPIVAIQSNNLFDIPEHVNCVHSVDHMQKKFPMREVIFAGELQLKGYKRVMLIGRP